MPPLVRKIAGLGLILLAMLIVMAQLKTCVHTAPPGEGVFEAGRATGGWLAALVFFVLAFFSARTGIRMLRAPRQDDAT